jgi:ferredoxin
MIRISHFRSKCIGCNACVEVAPDRWRISKKDGKSVLVGGKEKKGITTLVVGDDELNANKIASKMCPTNIIQVEKIKKAINNS